MGEAKSLNAAMWIFAVLLISMVVLQAVLFLRLALRENKAKQHFSREEIKSFLKIGSVSVIGPSISTVMVALSLVALVGSGLTYMRVGVLGAAPLEMFVASMTAETIGVNINDPMEFTASALVVCGFGMAFATMPAFLTTVIELPMMDKLASKAGKHTQKRSFIPYMGKAAMMGMIGSLVVSYLTNVYAWIAFSGAGLVTYCLIKYAARTKKRAVMDWAITISMVAGLAAAQSAFLLMS